MTGLLAALLIGGLLGGAVIRPARAIDAGDILKVGGVLLAVNQFGDGLNHLLNNLLSQQHAEAKGMTKVVPILSVGRGTYLGAAQVVGIPALTQRVQAVATVETVFGKADGMLLVPISTKKPGSSLAKVDGVGVSAIIDLKL